MPIIIIMTDYRRAKNGLTYFFTVVTYNRRKILCLDKSREIFKEIILEVKQKYPFTIDALVLLPDHIHAIWTLSDKDNNYSLRWGLIKKEFTKRIKDFLPQKDLTKSRIEKREGTIWQRRFWEHQIQDQDDFNKHCDYIHYNPVKHNLVKEPRLWSYSSFHRFVKDGYYEENFGNNIIEIRNIIDLDLE